MPGPPRHGGGAHLKTSDAAVPRGGGLCITHSAGLAPLLAPPQRTCRQHDRGRRLAAQPPARGGSKCRRSRRPPVAPTPAPGSTHAGPGSPAARALNPPARPGTAPTAAATSPHHQTTPAACLVAPRARWTRRAPPAAAPCSATVQKRDAVRWFCVLPTAPTDTFQDFLYLNFAENGPARCQRHRSRPAAVPTPRARPGQPTIEGPGRQAPPGRRKLLSKNSEVG